MRVMLISDFFPPLIGGAEQVIADTATDLVALGHTVAVATLWHAGQPEREVMGGATIFRLQGAAQRFNFLFSNSGRRFHPPLQDPLMVRELREVMSWFRPEVIHGQSWMLFSALPLRREFDFKSVAVLQDYSLLCPKKTLLRREGPWCDVGLSRHCLDCSAESFGHIKGAVTTAGLVLGRRQARHIDAYVAVSSYVADVHRRYGLTDSSPLVVIPDFVRDEVAGAPPRPPLPGLPDQYVLFLGALGRHKGVQVLLDAYGQIAPTTPLVMIGAEQATTPTYLPPGVTLIKGLPHEDVLRALDHCLFLVAPSLWPEPFGIVAIEAMARGKAVVASRAGGLTDSVDDGTTGILVPPGDSAALAGAIRRLIADPALAREMGRAGQERCERHFVAGVVVPRLVEVYRSVLDDPERQVPDGRDGRG